MKAASTNVARAMGYLGSSSVEERLYDGSNVIAVGFQSGLRSYHKGEGSAKDMYLKARAAFRDAGGRRRSSRTVLYG